MEKQLPGDNLVTTSVVERAVELIFRLSYAPVDVSEMLASAETRSRIRRLTPPQLFFGLTRLDDEQMQLLLPQVTEEQWTAVLDLSLWLKDTARTDRLLGWQRHLVEAPDSVARKLWRSTPSQLWQLAFRRDLKVARRVGEDEFDQALDEEAEVLLTADGSYAIQLPEDTLRAALWSNLLPRLFELEGEQMAILLEESLYRTETELEEEAYRERCARLEDLGFQDYFEALSIYSPLPVDASLPLKNRDVDTEAATLPETIRESGPGTLLFKGLARIEDATLLQQLMEEIFYLCNKLLSADGVQADDAAGLRETIRKGLAGLNLGLSLWSRDQLSGTESALRRHFLVSLFQVAYGQLLELQSRAREVAAKGLRADLYEQATLEALAEGFPHLVEIVDGQMTSRHLWNRADLAEAHQRLDRIQEHD